MAINENVFPLKIETIANWQLDPTRLGEKDVYAAIPAFQRGLVWRPAQVEVLWDSLLRQIPIGVLSLISQEGTERFAKKTKACKSGYWLLDGQQRANAIALGFQEFGNVDERSNVLWIDLLPDAELKDRSNRRYFFYLTTPSRPWGSEIDDQNDENNSQKLPVGKYRQALEDIGFDSNKCLKPSPQELWPVSATLPIPFSVFRSYIEYVDEHKGVTISTFVERKYGDSSYPWYSHFKSQVKECCVDEADFRRLHNNCQDVMDAFKKACETPVMAFLAPKTLTEDSSVEMDGRDSEIAVYFTRLNQSGTMPSDEDLNYSILKTANPELGKIDEFAVGRMHPARMAQYAMRAYKSARGFAGDVSRRDAYELGREPKFAKMLSAFKRSVVQVDKWLLYGDENRVGMPPITRTQIANAHENLYLFLILLAKHSSGVRIEAKHIIAMTLLLAWFGEDSKLKYEEIYEEIRGQKTCNFKARVKRWLCRQISSDALRIPPPLRCFEELTGVVSNPQSSMEQVEAVWNPEGYRQPFNDIWYWSRTTGRGVVLYACRKYLCKVFPTYDPASVVWNEDDCPWDYDHIIPSSWLSGKGCQAGDWKSFVREFINSIGNIAPIPFSWNRIKQDEAPGRKYLVSRENRLGVLLDGSFMKNDFFREDYRRKLEEKKTTAFRFASAVAERMERLYREWLRLPVFELLDFSGLLPARHNMIGRVKKMMDSLKCTCYVALLEEDGLVKLKEPLEVWDIARSGLACGSNVTFRDTNRKRVKCFACLTEQDGEYEIGLRRLPESDRPRVDGDWWIEETHNWTESLDEALKHLRDISSRNDVEKE